MENPLFGDVFPIEMGCFQCHIGFQGCILRFIQKINPNKKSCELFGPDRFLFLFFFGGDPVTTTIPKNSQDDPMDLAMFRKTLVESGKSKG